MCLKFVDDDNEVYCARRPSLEGTRLYYIINAYNLHENSSNLPVLAHAGKRITEVSIAARLRTPFYHKTYTVHQNGPITRAGVADKEGGG